MKRKETTETTIRSTNQCDALVMSEHFTPPISVIDSNGKKHWFRTFLWMGRWGICSKNKQKVYVRAMANYLYAKVLNHTKLLIAGSPNYGWDVYSLEGEFLERLEPMSLDEAANFLNFKKRNHQ